MPGGQWLCGELTSYKYVIEGDGQSEGPDPEFRGKAVPEQEARVNKKAPRHGRDASVDIYS